MTTAVVRSAALGAISGFLTRPCCILPAALSLVGVSSAGMSGLLVAYRELFLVASASMLGISIWVNFRREGGWFNRALAVCAAAVAFSLAADWF